MSHPLLSFLEPVLFYATVFSIVFLPSALIYIWRRESYRRRFHNDFISRLKDHE